MEETISKLLNQLSIFHSHKGGVKEVIDNNNPQHKCVVIDSLPDRTRATYCIFTPEGWIVFSRAYDNKDVVYPSIYGLLFRKLDIDTFSEASLKGMSIDDINNACKDLLNDYDYINDIIGAGDTETQPTNDDRQC